MDKDKALAGFEDAVATGDEQEIYGAAVTCAHAGVGVVELGKRVRAAGFPPAVALQVFNLYKEVKG